MNMYRPLPSYLTIKQSNINGLGLFAVEPIRKSIDIGISHVADRHFANGYIRTPLGGFINHNTTPNCKTFTEGRLISIITLTDIKAGDEITLKYTMYDPSR
jgi:SET domain-containing protein|tara:strand:+ start:125 stop:427 length:303 start_codon:yes stop_codon:yes gene_type:complete